MTAKNVMGPFFTFISDGSYAPTGLADHPASAGGFASRGSRSTDTWTGSAKRPGAAIVLPSEAEWEYAAPRGNGHDRVSGATTGNRVCDYANFADRSSGYQAGLAAPCAESIKPDWTAEVGNYRPNPWGLHDMAGNVQELVADCWHHSYEGAPTDGSAWIEPDCTLFVTRGGDYELLHVSMRASERLFYGYVPEVSVVEGPTAGDNGRSNVMGFRVALTLE